MMYGASSRNKQSNNKQLLSPQIISKSLSSKRKKDTPISISTVASKNNNNTTNSSSSRDHHSIVHSNSEDRESASSSSLSLSNDSAVSAPYFSSSSSSSSSGSSRNRNTDDEEQREEEIMSATTKDTAAEGGHRSTAPLSPESPSFASFMNFVTGSGSDSDRKGGGKSTISTSYSYANRYTNMKQTIGSNFVNNNNNSLDPSSTATNTNTNTNTKILKSSKRTQRRRCYRLNLERPFDIHCEQSPLEYGDYMTPWTKEVYPKTVGPTEYCPPRHLGGHELLWRELMKWSDGKGGLVGEEEEKVNSLDQLEEEEQGVDGECKDGTSVVKSLSSHMDSISIINEEEKQGSADQLDDDQQQSLKHNPASPTGGWRSLTPEELSSVQKLGEQNSHGELTFDTYDLSHMALNITGKKLRVDDIVAGADTQGAANVNDTTPPLRTVFSMDSTTSEDERANPKTPEEMSNETARLFRRSELSIKEKQEREEKQEAELREKLRLEEIERQEREKRAAAGGTDSTPTSPSVDNLSMSMRKRASRMGKKVNRTLSRTFSNISTTPSMGSSSSRRASSSGSSINTRPSMNRRSSTQALAIDRARDVADESDDDEEEDGEDGERRSSGVSGENGSDDDVSLCF